MDPKTRQEIEEKAGQYETEKKRIKDKIGENLRTAMEKLMELERELLVEMEAELGENPFVEFLGDESHTEDDAKEIMKRELHHDFGPDDESFKSLFKEIESLKAWRKKPKPEQLIPKNVTVKEARLDSISISWNAVEGAKNYLVEVDGDEVFWKPGTSSTFTKNGLIPDTEHSFRVRTVHERLMSEWSNTVRGRTKKLPAPSSVRIKSNTQDSITLAWNAVEGALFYQIEMDKSKSYEISTVNEFTKRGLIPDTEHAFRICAIKGNSMGELSDVVKGRTQKAPEFSEYAWKECPGYVNQKMKYSVGDNNTRIARFRGNDGYYCTIIGNTPLPCNKVTSLKIKILRSKGNNGKYIMLELHHLT